jgi:hypothetical protein
MSSTGCYELQRFALRASTNFRELRAAPKKLPWVSQRKLRTSAESQYEWPADPLGFVIERIPLAIAGRPYVIYLLLVNQVTC